MRQTKGVTKAAEAVVEAMKQAVEEPGATTARAAARAIVKLRKHFTYEGRPDWAGRSGDYRDLIERLYRQAEVPSDSESNMQANIRYHLGNALRDMAPEEDLAALGLATRGPLGRIQEARAARPRKAKEPAAKVSYVADPVLLADLAASVVRTLASMSPGHEVERPLRELVDQVLAVLAGLGPSAAGNGD